MSSYDALIQQNDAKNNQLRQNQKTLDLLLNLKQMPPLPEFYRDVSSQLKTNYFLVKNV